MRKMIEMLLQHEGEPQNTVLIGESADIILRRLMKALSISDLWIWCEPSTGSLATATMDEFSLAIAIELERELTLPPNSLQQTIQQPGGTAAARLLKMLKQSWRLPPASSPGIVFCVSAFEVLSAVDESGYQILNVFKDAETAGLPFRLVVLDLTAMMELPEHAAALAFFKKVLHC